MHAIRINEQRFGEYPFALMENFPPVAEELFWMLVLACPKKGTILELGSGATTGLIKEHREVYSIEDNPDWVGKYNDKEHYVYAPRENGFYDKGVLVNLPRYDVLFVDGPAHDSRIDRFVDNIRFFRPDVPWFFDDTAHAAFEPGLQRLQAVRGKTMIRFDKNYKQFGVITSD
jgi:hypothetical protein